MAVPLAMRLAQWGQSLLSGSRLANLAPRVRVAMGNVVSRAASVTTLTVTLATRFAGVVGGMLGSRRVWQSAKFMAFAAMYLGKVARLAPRLYSRLPGSTTRSRFVGLFNYVNMAAIPMWMAVLAKDLFDGIGDDEELAEEKRALGELLDEFARDGVIDLQELEVLREEAGEELLPYLLESLGEDAIIEGYSEEVQEEANNPSPLAVPDFSTSSESPLNAGDDVESWDRINDLGAAASQHEAFSEVSEEAQRVVRVLGGVQNVRRLHRLMHLSERDLEILLR